MLQALSAIVQPELLIEFNLVFWVDKKIEYKYNNEGFRVPYNFNDKDSGIVTLGCSFTEGVGLPYEYTWGYKLAKHLNVKHCIYLLYS